MTATDRHPSRREAERLLDHPGAHDSALGRLLSAARAPAEPVELRREEHETVAFHRAHLSVPRPGVAPIVPAARRVGGRAAVRAVVATGAVVALTSGGFALAGSADLPSIPGLPDLPGQAADRATEAVAKTPEPSEASSSSTATEAGSATAETGSATAEPESSGTGSPGSRSAMPTPSFEGLCRAFQATDRSNGKSLDSAAFTALAAAAGGATQISTWCVDLIGEPRPTGKPSSAPGKPTDKPSPTGKPSTAPGKPTDKPSPTGKPSTAPGKPTDKPSPTGKPGSAPGKPTDKPSPTGKPGSAPGKPTDKPSPIGKGGGKNP